MQIVLFKQPATLIAMVHFLCEVLVFYALEYMLSSLSYVEDVP